MTNTDIRESIRSAPIVPVVTIEKAGDAPALATAFAQAGVTTVEVTLRTEAALQAIIEMKAAEPSLMIGAGTVLSEGDLDAALKAGASFVVSPGFPPALRDAASLTDIPFIPGVATPSEAMARFDEGFDLLKLYPAEILGGITLLKAMSGPLPHIQFMPTGGISEDNFVSYLGQKNVLGVGGTWLARRREISAGKWGQIKARTQKALAAITQQAV